LNPDNRVRTSLQEVDAACISKTIDDNKWEDVGLKGNIYRIPGEYGLHARCFLQYLTAGDEVKYCGTPNCTYVRDYNHGCNFSTDEFVPGPQENQMNYRGSINTIQSGLHNMLGVSVSIITTNSSIFLSFYPFSFQWTKRVVANHDCVALHFDILGRDHTTLRSASESLL
jgi:hypothetical protein